MKPNAEVRLCSCHEYVLRYPKVKNGYTEADFEAEYKYLFSDPFKWGAGATAAGFSLVEIRSRNNGRIDSKYVEIDTPMIVLKKGE